MLKIQFIAGEGIHYHGGVNYLIYDDNDVKLYAEIAIPDNDFSEDYGYITMRKALQAAIEKHIPDLEFCFQYDGQEANLEKDAEVNKEVYVEIEKGDIFYTATI